MLLQMASFQSFLWLSNIPLYIYIYTHIHICHIFFIHSSVDGHLDSFHDLAVVNSAAMNMGDMYLFELEFSSFPVVCPGVGLLDHVVALFSVF